MLEAASPPFVAGRMHRRQGILIQAVVWKAQNRHNWALEIARFHAGSRSGSGLQVDFVPRSADYFTRARRGENQKFKRPRRDALAPSASGLFLPDHDQRFRNGVGSAATRTRSRISIADIGA